MTCILLEQPSDFWNRRHFWSKALLLVDEMKPWISTVAGSGDIVDKSIASFLISQKKSKV
jgi:hypothetical protein